jgi:hypothetical protein
LARPIGDEWDRWRHSDIRDRGARAVQALRGDGRPHQRETGLTNSYFLTLNTAIVGLIAALRKVPTSTEALWLAIPLVAILGECHAWFYLVRSYRLLSGAKYRVVGALEERLPASPFWRAEWWALGEGKDRALYWPLSHIEQWIPVLFALTYIGGFLAIVLA